MKKEWFKGTWLKWLAHPSIIYHYMKDVFTGKYKDYSRGKLIVIFIAIIYVFLPFDFLHDWVFAVGWIDDAAIVAWALSSLDSELEKYKRTLG